MALRKELLALPLIYLGVIAYQACSVPSSLEDEITPLEDVLGCTLSECKDQKPICGEKHICLDDRQCVYD